MAKKELNEKESMMREQKDLKKTNKELEKALGRWELFWGWVKAHSNPGALSWLERLWLRCPRRVPDGCWGDGQ